jgi:Zn-dependent oligopeptidase
VPRDFVEYPSQVNEMWATWPEVLANYAKHYQTGAPMPKELLDKVQAPRRSSTWATSRPSTWPRRCSTSAGTS